MSSSSLKEVDMELIEQLAKNLGVSEEAAKGGSGLLFQMAKEKLGSTQVKHFYSLCSIIFG